MKLFQIILYQELLLSWHNLAKIFANLLFFLISVAVFFLISQQQQYKDSLIFLSISIIWFSLLSCLIFSTSEFLKRDFHDGTIEQILTSVENFEIAILAKMIANWIITALPILVASTIIAIIMELNISLIYNFVIMVFLASLAINFICSFCGSLSILENSAPTIGIIAMPLIIPIILIAHGGLIYEDMSSWKIILGLVVFSGAILTFATAKIVTIAVE